jgi:hypothetical protein
MAAGRCSCDNWLLNEVVETVLEVDEPSSDQPQCGNQYCTHQSFYALLMLVLDTGVQFIPGVGKILDAGLDMATMAAQMAAYLYPEEDRK